MRAFFSLSRSSRSGRKRMDKIRGVMSAPLRELEARAIPLRPRFRSAVPDAHAADSPRIREGSLPPGRLLSAGGETRLPATGAVVRAAGTSPDSRLALPGGSIEGCPAHFGRR